MITTHDAKAHPDRQQASPVAENLVAFVTCLLADRNHPRPRDWLAYLQPGVDTLDDESYQRFAINRAWRVIFGKLYEAKQVDTMDVRYCLVDHDCSAQDWKRLFETGVLPCILEHAVPLVQ